MIMIHGIWKAVLNSGKILDRKNMKTYNQFVSEIKVSGFLTKSGQGAISLSEPERKVIETEFAKRFKSNSGYKFHRGATYLWADWDSEEKTLKKSGPDAGKKVGAEKVMVVLKKRKPGTGFGWMYEILKAKSDGKNITFDAKSKSKPFSASVDGDLDLLKKFLKTL